MSEQDPFEKHTERLDNYTATGSALSEWFGKELAIAQALCALPAVHYNPEHMALQGLWDMAYKAGKEAQRD